MFFSPARLGWLDVVKMYNEDRNNLVGKVLKFISGTGEIMDVEIISSDESTVILLKKDSKWGEVTVDNDLLVNFVVYHLGTSVKKEVLTFRSNYHKFETDYVKGFA